MCMYARARSQTKTARGVCDLNIIIVVADAVVPTARACGGRPPGNRPCTPLLCCCPDVGKKRASTLNALHPASTYHWKIAGLFGRFCRKNRLRPETCDYDVFSRGRTNRNDRRRSHAWCVRRPRGPGGFVVIVCVHRVQPRTHVVESTGDGCKPTDRLDKVERGRAPSLFGEIVFRTARA